MYQMLFKCNPLENVVVTFDESDIRIPYILLSYLSLIEVEPKFELNLCSNKHPKLIVPETRGTYGRKIGSISIDKHTLKRKIIKSNIYEFIDGNKRLERIYHKYPQKLDIILQRLTKRFINRVHIKPSNVVTFENQLGPPILKQVFFESYGHSIWIPSKINTMYNDDLVITEIPFDSKTEYVIRTYDFKRYFDIINELNK